MLGGTSDISQLCDHGFYDWVIFRYNPIQCPHEKPVLSRYLGTAIDFGPDILLDNVPDVNLEDTPLYDM